MVFAEFRGTVEIIPTGRTYEQTYGGLFHVENGKIRLFREYYDPAAFKYAFGLDEGGKPDLTAPGVVVDDGEVLCSLIDECGHQFDRAAGFPEPTDHDGGPIVDVGDRIGGGGDLLVDHGTYTVPIAAASFRAYSTRV